MKRTMLLLALLGLARLAFAQGEILGTVKDAATGETLPNATVVLMIDSQVMYHTTTDIQGNYIIKPVQSGTYDVQASFVGYKAETIEDVGISNGQTVEQDFGMGNNVLGAVVVTGKKKPVPGLINTGFAGEVKSVNSAEIESSAEIDVISLVAIVTPGVYQADSGDPLRFRGAREGGTLYMIDGMRIRGEPYILQNTVGDMQIYTGGVPAKYGDFNGGVIVIETKGYRMGN